MIEIVEKKRLNRLFWARMFYAQLIILFCLGLTMLIVRALCHSKYQCGKESGDIVNISVTRLNSSTAMLPSDGKGLRMVSIMLSMGKPWPKDPELVAKSGFIRIASGKLEDKLEVDIEEMKNFASSLSLELRQKPPIESFPRPDLSSIRKNFVNIWTKIGPFLNLRPSDNAVGLESNESKSVVESPELKTDGKEIESVKKRLSMETRPKQRGGGGASGFDRSGGESHAKTEHGRLADTQPQKIAKPKTTQGGWRRYVNRCLATTTKRRHIGDVSTAAGEMKANSKVKLPASGEILSQSTTERNYRIDDEITNQRHATNGPSSSTLITEPTDNTEAHDLLISSTKATKTSNDPVKQANADSENETPYDSSPLPLNPKERIKPLPNNTFKNKLGKENLIPEYKMSSDFAESIVAREVKPDEESPMESNWPSKFHRDRPATADFFVGKGQGDDEDETVNETNPSVGPTSMLPIENANSENDATQNVKVQLITKFDIFKDMLDKALAKFDDDDAANERQLKSIGNLENDLEGVGYSGLDDDLDADKGSDGDDSRTSVLREVGHIATQLDSLGMLWNAMKPSLKLLSRSDAGKVLDAIVDIIQLDDRTDFEQLDNRKTVADESNQPSVDGGEEPPDDRRGGNRSKSLQSSASATDGAAAAPAAADRRRRGQPRRRRSADSSEADGRKTKGEEEIDDDFVRVMEEREERKKRRGGYDDYIFGDNPGFVLEHQKRDVASDQMEEDAISRELANLLIEKVYNRLLKKVETPGGEKTASAAEQKKKKERAKRSVKKQDQPFVKRNEAFTDEEREQVRDRLCQKARFVNSKLTDDDGVETDYYSAMIVGQLCNYTDDSFSGIRKKSSNSTALTRFKRQTNVRESGDDATEAENREEQENQEEESTGEESKSETAEENRADVNEVQLEEEDEMNAAAAAAAAEAAAAEEDVEQLKVRASENREASEAKSDEMKNADDVEYESAEDAAAGEKRASADDADWKEALNADANSKEAAEKEDQEQEEEEDEEKEEKEEEEMEAKRRANWNLKKRSSGDEAQESKGDFETDDELWNRNRREGEDGFREMSGPKDDAEERALRDVDDNRETGKREADRKTEWNAGHESKEEAKKTNEAAGRYRVRRDLGARGSLRKQRFNIEEYADEVLNDALPAGLPQIPGLPDWARKRRNRNPREAESGVDKRDTRDLMMLGRSADENEDGEEDKGEKQMRESEEAEHEVLARDQSLFQSSVDRAAKGR